MTFLRLCCAVAVAFLLAAGQAHAWGIKEELRQPRALNATLTAKALNTGAVRYCLTSETQEALLDGAEQEFTAALALWLEQLRGLAGTSPVMSRTECAEADIRVSFGPTKANDHSNGAYLQFMTDPATGTDYLILRVNTDFRWEETRSLPGNPNGTYRWQPFVALARVDAGETQASLIRSVSYDEKLSLDQFAERRGLPPSTVFWTLYRVFLHELGHAFGLCDTQSSLFAAQCDPQASDTGPQPSSLMKDSNYFYLTEDDIQGLAALVRRVAHPMGR